MAKLIKSAFADEYSDSLQEQCEMLNEFGINYLELRSVEGKNVIDMTACDVANIKSTLSSHEIKVSSIGSPLGKIMVDKVDEAYYEKAKRIFDLACELDTNYVRCFSFYLPEGKTFDECQGVIYDNMEKLIRIAETFSLTLCHENEANIYGESPKRCLELFERFDGKLKGVFDMGNFVLDGFEPYPYAYDLLKKYIAYFHIKDALAVGAIVPPGKGEARIKDVLDDYNKNEKKDAFITLEPHLQTFSGLNALVGKAFDNPYKYENQKIAFIDAINKLEELLCR